MSRSTAYAIVLFVGLAIITTALLVAAGAATDAFARAVLIQLGCVIFGAGLTVFLLRLLATADRV
jgi:hypothetical protein